MSAERGNAWWLWCQDSPNDGSASQNTLRRLVVGREAPAAEEVADRVDRPGHVVQQEDAHQARPTAARSARRAAAAQGAAQRRTGRAAASTTTAKGRWITRMPRSSKRSRAYLSRLGAARARSNSQPTCACQSPRSAPRTRAVAGVRAVRVALLVGVGVVLAVVGDPVDHRSLDGHRAERPRTRTRAACRSGRRGASAAGGSRP